MPVGVVWSLRPEPGPARAWLERELSHAEYHQESLTDRLLRLFGRLLDWVTTRASGAGGLSFSVAVVVAVVALAVALAVLPRLRRTPLAESDRSPLSVGPTTATEHRARAEAALADGDPARAVVEAMRALARRMVDRGVLDDLPGSTAHEIAASLGSAFPERRERLARAADSFDAVQYGDGSALPEEARELLDLEADLRRARPTLGATPAGAVPR